jgi:hypothetical protein
MRADLERINLLFKTKNITNNGHGEDERHDTMKGGWKYSEEAEVVDLSKNTYNHKKLFKKKTPEEDEEEETKRAMGG